VSIIADESINSRDFLSAGFAILQVKFVPSLLVFEFTMSINCVKLDEKCKSNGGLGGRNRISRAEKDAASQGEDARVAVKGVLVIVK